MRDVMGRETKREKIDGLHGIELFMAMAEGNPGALSVVTKLSERWGALATSILIVILDRMNIRGSQIWVAYKDFAGGDLDALALAITRKDPEMVAKVNEACSSHGELARTFDTTENGGGQ